MAAGIFPKWLGVCSSGGSGDCPECPPPETVYIEVPGGMMGGGIDYKKIIVSANVMINKRKKKLKIKAKLL